MPAQKRVAKKGVASERVQTIRSIVREVTGFAPYERRAMELIRNSKVCIAVRALREQLADHSGQARA